MASARLLAVLAIAQANPDRRISSRGFSLKRQDFLPDFNLDGLQRTLSVNAQVVAHWTRMEGDLGEWGNRPRTDLGSTQATRVSWCALTQ